MKRAKVLELLREARELERANEAIHYDTLSIDFRLKTVTFRGHVVPATADVLSFPMLSTDHLIIVPKGGDVL